MIIEITKYFWKSSQVDKIKSEISLHYNIVDVHNFLTKDYFKLSMCDREHGMHLCILPNNHMNLYKSTS